MCEETTICAHTSMHEHADTRKGQGEEMRRRGGGIFTGSKSRRMPDY